MTNCQFSNPVAEHQFGESILDSLKTPSVLLREDSRISFANRAFYRRYGFNPLQIEDKPFLEIYGENWIGSALRITPAEILGGQVEREFAGAGGTIIHIALHPVESATTRMILVTVEETLDQNPAGRVATGHGPRLDSSIEAGVAALQKVNQMLQTEVLGREQVQTALHASEHALLQSREELRHLSASLLNAQDAERRRVSRELHDDLSQKVAKLQFDIEILEQKVPFDDVRSAKQRLHEVGQQAAALSNDLRRVAHQLHPATLDHLGLSVALRSYTEEFSRSAAIPVKFTSLFVPRRIPVEVASGLYRIVQEALRNIGKHAGDAAVEIVLAGVPEGLALFIRDNGRGFDAEAARAKGGLGLISMQERVRLLEGTFSVETRPGKGVLLSILCPLSTRNL